MLCLEHGRAIVQVIKLLYCLSSPAPATASWHCWQSEEMLLQVPILLLKGGFCRLELERD